MICNMGIFTLNGMLHRIREFPEGLGLGIQSLTKPEYVVQISRHDIKYKMALWHLHPEIDMLQCILNFSELNLNILLPI